MNTDELKSYRRTELAAAANIASMTLRSWTARADHDRNGELLPYQAEKLSAAIEKLQSGSGSRNVAVREFLKAHGISQLQLSLELGASEGCVFQWLHGDLTPERIERIAAAVRAIKGADIAVEFSKLTED